jgi:hypothetical protein
MPTDLMNYGSGSINGFGSITTGFDAGALTATSIPKASPDTYRS